MTTSVETTNREPQSRGVPQQVATIQLAPILRPLVDTANDDDVEECIIEQVQIQVAAIQQEFDEQRATKSGAQRGASTTRMGNGDGRVTLTN